MHFHLHAAAVAAVDTQAGRLRDHDEIGLQATLIDEVLPAQAVAILFLHRGGHVHGDVVGNPEPFQHRAGINAGRDSALHVARAAAVQDTVLDIAGVRVPIP